MADLAPAAVAADIKKGFTTFLTKAGSLFKTTVTVIFPAAVTLAEEVEPIVDLALPAYGVLFNTCVSAAILAEQAAAAAAASGANLTGEQKFAKVLAVVGPMLTAQLQQNGVTGASATSAITQYINAIVALLNGPIATVKA